MHRTQFGTWVLIILVGSILFPLTAMADDFPSYKNIEPNILFWTKVYTQYTTTQAIVHDAVNLNIIYDVIELEPHSAINARKINRRRMKSAKSKYQKILKQLAIGKKNMSSKKISSLFGINASSNSYRQASERIRCQIGQRDRFREGLIRSGKYIAQIRKIFNANGLPEKLAYLPHVESSFNYQAYSKFGAAGIWQFTRSTGKRFMNVGYVLDERRDPIIATYAAAALLKENFEKLGNWPLAITAYNHGAAGMARAKKKHGTYPVIFEKYRSKTFKFASRNFYSEFLAAVQAASNYQTYFGELTLDHPFPTRTVNLEGYISLQKLCKHYNVHLDQVRSLNPALRPPVFNAQKYVPKGYAFRLPANIELASSGEKSDIPPSLYEKRQKPSLFYTVQHGDTASQIARTQGVKLSDLILANNLSRRATIYPKQTLRIPRPDEKIPTIKEVASKRNKPIVTARAESKKPEIVQQPNQAKASDDPLPVLASAIAIPSFPQKGEPPLSKKSMPKQIDIPSAEIVTADMRFEKIKKHHQLTVGTIQVEVEETLGHFAEWAQVRTQRIRRLNRFPFGKKLRLHQKVKIPLDKVTPQAFEELRYEYHKRLQEDFFSSYNISELRPYYVENGDNLWTLSYDKFDIPMWLLKNCNPKINFSALKLRHSLMVPIIEKNKNNDTGIDSKNEDQFFENGT